MKKSSYKHLFALYAQNLARGQVGAGLEYKDAALWQRIVRILRLRAGQIITLFDGACSIDITLDQRTFLDKKQEAICGTIISCSENHVLLPEIIFCPCITKKDAFESIIYSAAQLGVSKIVPVISEKAQRGPSGAKEVERLYKIMIAACEQARQFVIPEFCVPVLLTSVPEIIAGEQNIRKICFECDGVPVRELVSAPLAHDTKIVVILGPEGGLTDQEFSFLQAQKFDIYALTPTILRSQDAALVGLGFLRSIM